MIHRFSGLDGMRMVLVNRNKIQMIMQIRERFLCKRDLLRDNGEL